MVTGSGRSSAALSARATMAMRYPPFALAAMSQPGAMAPDQRARFSAASASSAGKSSSATSVAVRNMNDGLSRCSVTGSTPRDTEFCRTSTEMRACIPGCCPVCAASRRRHPASLRQPDRVNPLSSAATHSAHEPCRTEVISCSQQAPRSRKTALGHGPRPVLRRLGGWTGRRARGPRRGGLPARRPGRRPPGAPGRAAAVSAAQRHPGAGHWLGHRLKRGPEHFVAAFASYPGAGVGPATAEPRTARSLLVHRRITVRSYGVQPRAGGPVLPLPVRRLRAVASRPAWNNPDLYYRTNLLLAPVTPARPPAAFVEPQADEAGDHADNWYQHQNLPPGRRRDADRRTGW